MQKKKKFKPMEGRTNPRAAPKMSMESQQLFDAIEDEKIDEIERLIKAGADLTMVYETSPTCSRAPCQPLHAAAVKNLPAAVDLLVAAGAPLDGGDKKKRGMRLDRDRPITGTRLLREWQGIEYVVTVTADGFEWQGRPYKSLSAIARAITGTRWNGWVFFGLKNHRGRT